jgi:hypothetical protein
MAIARESIVRVLALAAATGLVLVVSGGCTRRTDAIGTPASSAVHRLPAEPRIFAPGTISDDREQWRITFTPDGGTAYFAVSDAFFPFSRRATIHVSHRAGSGWSTPEAASFSGTYSDMDPFITPDGRRLYFSSIRPVEGATRGDLDLWMVERRPGGWSEPIHLGPEVNSAEDELYASATADGTLYFASGPLVPQPGRHFDIYSARRDGAGFHPREALGPGVNTVPTGAPGEGPQDAWEFNPEVSANGRTLVFASLRPGGFGLGDLYVSHLRDGEWTPARNLGPAVNTQYDEYHPTLSRDGRDLFFVRRIVGADPYLLVRGDFYRVSTAGLGLR